MVVRSAPIVFLLLWLPAGCVSPTAPAQTDRVIVEQPKEPGVNYSWTVPKVTRENNDFAFELYSHLITERDGNLFLSPASISMALAMTYAGADGQTAEEMANVLHFELPSDQLHATFAVLLDNLRMERPGCQLLMANRLWGQKDYHFLPEFLKTTRLQYGAEMAELDFINEKVEAAETISTWVEERTQGKITGLIEPESLNSMTRLVLTNAIYFQGDWAVRFLEGATREGPFYVRKDKKIDVPLMNRKGRFRFATAIGLKILELPYIEKNVSMLVLLPDKVDGLADLEKLLTADNLSKWNANLSEADVEVVLPKFTMSTEFQLKEVLQTMGMTTAFVPREADFSRMNGSRDLYISTVVHKAFVEVNEKGTEAAAATGAIVQFASAPREQTFRADHPFVFVIQDKQFDSVLFVGRVVEPN